MFEVATATYASKREHYEDLREQASGILAGEPDLIANAANFSALVFHSLPDLNWAGFYLFDGTELVVGPFQGKPACVRIAIGRGVCGTAAQTRQTQLVRDVHAFEGHIACDAASNSEIVVPLVRKDGTLLGVWDVDSPLVARFDEDDRAGMEALCAVFMAAADGAAAGATRGSAAFAAQQRHHRLSRSFHADAVGRREHLRRGLQSFGLEQAAHDRQRLCGLIARKLVGLGQQHVAWQGGVLAERQHHPVELLERMADVHDQHHATQAAPPVQIGIDFLLPVLAQRLRDLRIAVARQVDQADLQRCHPLPLHQRRQRKGHHLLGTAGRLGCARQAVMTGERIERAGFAGIGTAGERHFGTVVGGQLADAVGGQHEAGALEGIRGHGEGILLV